MKKILLLALISNVTLADNEYPVIDISDAKKYPPTMVTSSDYHWPTLENDIKDYKEPKIQFTNKKCEFGIDALGGCRPRKVNQKVVKYKSELKYLSQGQREIINKHFNSTIITKSVQELNQIFKKEVHLKTNYHHI